MATDRYHALSEILSLFKLRWEENASAVLGIVDTPHIEYPGIDVGFLPTGNEWWCRISFQTPVTEQGSFCENVVISGSRRFTTYGLVFVQLFAPKGNASFVGINAIGNFVQKVFRERTPNVVFRNAKVVDLPSENGCLRANVVCEFEFDEIGNISGAPFVPESSIYQNVDDGEF